MKIDKKVKPLVAGIGPCGAKCLEAAGLVRELQRVINEIDEIGGVDSPLDDDDTLDGKLQDIHSELYQAAASAAVCALRR